MRVRLLGSRRGARTWARGVWGGVALVVLCLCVLVPGLFVLPAIDRDESRFAQASRQMWTSDDWVVPKVQDRPRLNKPPLTYWLQGTSARFLSGGDPARDAIWMYRLPGALATLCSVLLTWRLGMRLMDHRAAWLGAALLALSPLVIFDAHQARSDQLLLLGVVATQWCLWRTLCARRGSSRVLWTLATGVACGLAVLAKGPIAPLVAMCTLATLCVVRAPGVPRTRGMAGAFGLVAIGAIVAAACIVPWVVMVGERVGWEKYRAIVFDETLGRSVEPKEGHWGPPGYHVVLLVGLFFPGSLLAGVGVVHAVREGVRRGLRWAGRREVLFLLGWLVPAWVMFEVIGTKLPHYVMPLYPALALLTARATLRASAGMLRRAEGVLARVGFVAWGVVGVVLMGGVPLGVLAWRMTPAMPTGVHVLVVASCVLAGGLIVGATIAACVRRPLRALLLASAATVLSLSVTLQVLIPRAEQFWLPSRVARELERLDPSDARALGAFQYHEDSLIFLTHGRMERVADGDRAAWLATHPESLVVLPVEQVSEFPSLQVRSTLEGFNYSRGRAVRIVIAEHVPTATGEGQP